MAHSLEQFVGEKVQPPIFTCMLLHACVHSLNLVSFALSDRHRIIECLVHVCRLRKQYGLK